MSLESQILYEGIHVLPYDSKGDSKAWHVYAAGLSNAKPAASASMTDLLTLWPLQITMAIDRNS